ncbi:carbohydrate kinase family protein [Thermogutta sp.]|jgi:sugar/nucleoside kinase (ribokinase family)|uniref:carbohydrate kinase family protein n=1 Tax=Thermogutta sp. TaxID=1962930 RepID=UPI003C7CA754
MSQSLQVISAGILFADIACEPIERLPKAGELVPTSRIQLGLGGCAANVAVDLRKLDIPVGVAGCVGEDFFGQFIQESLKRSGVDTAGIRAVPQFGTAATMIVNVEGEDRRFISTPGANVVFRTDDIPAVWLEGAQILYIGGYLMMPGVETDDFANLLATARQRGVTVVLDVVLMERKDFQPILRKVLPHVDYFMPNDDESEIILGVSDPLEQARLFREMGARNVVITLGEKGCLFVGERGAFRAGVYPTTFVGGAGAGDAFDAGFIMGLLLGESPEGCVRWGSALGASCVRAIGTTEGVFNRTEAEAFLASHQLEIRSI